MLSKQVPGLDLNSEEFENLSGFFSLANSFFDLQRGSLIRKLSLHISGWGHDGYTSFPNPWIDDSPTMRNIQHLDIRTTALSSITVLPLSIYTCKTLVHLRLRWVTLVKTEFVSLPCLKILHLEQVMYPNKATLEKLISGSLLLEDLTLISLSSPKDDQKVFVKPQKKQAYFKRYQVKFRRRRDGKTDYRARIRLINQDKNKYNTPKYRYVVRFTNKDIIAQIVSATITGDIVLASAYAHELPRYGLKAGLTNYAAAYCTGLLLARRVLQMLEMDAEYEGNAEATGEDYSVEPTDTRRPFRALLDVGLVMTTTGNRVFGALKGALDGGLDIPHSDKRFAGFNKEGKNLDAEIHRKYIYGGHVADYMKLLMEDEPEKYQSHFSNYLKKDLAPENMEEMYKNVHAAIRADPSIKKSDKEAPKEHKRYNPKKLTYDERKASLIQRVKALNSAIGGDDGDEDEDDE
ncbi:hypothetical protein HID58_077009 [Brassica napus]|uniref:Ribosomal protein L5 eukaryotic C-terminal domain-containing protein n=2 Tax=Brassica napus TaxID=3708 RepID=A0ABQ7YP46_BRANA|nr:hypothetical protein HID58_077009 [Brassica napus]